MENTRIQYRKKMNKQNKITHIKGSRVRAHTQKMYKVGMAPNLYGLWSEDSLDRITGIEGAIQYSHERTIHYLNEDPFSQSPTTTLEELELPYE